VNLFVPDSARVFGGVQLGNYLAQVQRSGLMKAALA